MLVVELSVEDVVFATFGVVAPQRRVALDSALGWLCKAVVIVVDGSKIVWSCIKMQRVEAFDVVKFRLCHRVVSIPSRDAAWAAVIIFSQ